MKTQFLRSFLILGIALILLQQAEAQSKKNLDLPGQLPGGEVLLPNGWKLSPAGTQIPLGDLPLGMDVSPGGKFAVVTNNGVSKPTISIVDLQLEKVIQTMPVKNAWLGVKITRDGKSFFVSGGNENVVYWFRMQGDTAALADTIRFAEAYPKSNVSVAGLDVDMNDSVLFVACKGDSSLRIVNLKTSPMTVTKIPLNATPYTCLVSNDGKQVFISLWSSAEVAFYDVLSSTISTRLHVGDHPNDMAQSPDGKRLFVANANRNTVSVIDLSRSKVIETIHTALTPEAPPGSTPNSVAVNPDSKRLFVANADNNCVAVFDISKSGQTKSVGFIPVGWYPTAVRAHPSRNMLLVLNGKGGSSLPNPKGPNLSLRKRPPYEEYIGSLFKGTLSMIDIPSTRQLAQYSRKVYDNCPYVDNDAEKGTCGSPNPIPKKPGGQSPIKHIFYIIKENRTYDQLFGDIPEGNGDSTLCLFPERITPNHHALARDFVLLDNFYVDAEVSADGHNWSMAAYATDFVEKTWPTVYGGRGGRYDFEGENVLANPSSGYFWDLCRKKKVTYRSYGEYVINGKTDKDSAKAVVEGLVGHVAPFYRGWDMNYSDVDRVKAWMKEFDEAEARGKLERLQIIRLPNDHTSGTRAGSLTPRAYVAQNDLALGMIVERISKSRFWKEAAIFVLEDDAQNGPDHVDAHRSVALVISPYTKRHFVDHKMYSTSSMLRTMELILGLPPMTQYDAAATPMCNSFTSKPDFTPYQLREAMVDLEEKNIAGAYGSQRSAEMNLTEGDAIPDVEFSEIIWKAVKGADSEMPAPVRSAFVRVVKGD